MNLKLNKSQMQTLLNAIEYFQIFAEKELPVDETKWDESHNTISDIDDKLDSVYDQVNFFNIIEVSTSDISACLSALSVYSEIVSNDIKTSKCITYDKYQKELALRNISSLNDVLSEILFEEGVKDYPSWDILPGTDYS